MKPPPFFSHSTSTWRGMLSLNQRTAISARPTTNEKLTKLWTYLAIWAKALKDSGPDDRQQHELPEGDVQPVRPSNTKDTAVSQCEKRSKLLKRRTFLPERPAEIRIRPKTR